MSNPILQVSPFYLVAIAPNKGKTMKRMMFIATISLIFAASSPTFAQCAGCGADKNKADREAVEKMDRESRGGSTIEKAAEGLDRTSKDRSLNENADRQLRELEKDD